MLIFSAHADTNFQEHRMEDLGDGQLLGHMDNFIGVHCLMAAYFSGRMFSRHIRIELTEGEEIDMAGARRVAEDVLEDDIVIAIDVTGTPTEADFVIEKCFSEEMQTFLQDALIDMDFDMYEDCPDPVASGDESDVYREKTSMTCLLGIPVWGGDYNAGEVESSRHHIDQVIEAICLISEHYAARFHEEEEISD